VYHFRVYHLSDDYAGDTEEEEEEEKEKEAVV